MAISFQEISACDICGCSSGNYFIGPYPQFSKYFFGMRYSFRSFHSRIADDATQYSKDFYQTAELWGGYKIGKKWQLLAFVPYNINRQSSDDGIHKSNGPGDITVMANYMLLNTRKVNKKKHRITQQLWIGGGVKLPTGKFSPDMEEMIPTANNQAGTGSVDFIVNVMHTYHINNWGLNSNINYKINRSADNYKFGNRLSSSVFIFHSLYKGKTVFNPNLGLLYENLSGNTLSKVKVEDTGGQALLGATGLEINRGRVAIGFNAQLPISQNFSNQQTTIKIRGMAHLTFSL